MSLENTGGRGPVLHPGDKVRWRSYDSLQESGFRSETVVTGMQGNLFEFKNEVREVWMKSNEVWEELADLANWSEESLPLSSVLDIVHEELNLQMKNFHKHILKHMKK